MRIPSIDESFSNMFAGPKVDVDEALRTSGTPLFTEADVRESRSFLDRILRLIFVRKRITREYFSGRCRKYALEVLNEHSTKIDSTGSNLTRALQKGNITINRAEEATLKVLGYRLEDVVVTLVDEQGKKETFSLMEAFQQSEPDK